jgi:hypothetical protein
MDAIEKYEIVANGIKKYTQNFAIEESFITNATGVEPAKKNDSFSKNRHKDIWDGSFDFTSGAIIKPNSQESTKAGAQSYDVTFKLKIDIRRFLPLSNIKYLPAFAGKIELRVSFSTQGLVWCPRDPLRMRKTMGLKYVVGCTATPASGVTCEFQPIGGPCKTVQTATATATGITAIGIQDLTLKKSAQTITPRFIDTIFLLFPLTSRHRTVFRNPGFTNFYVTAGGFGQYPDIPYGMCGEPCLIEMIQNGVNLNSNSIGLSTELYRSVLGEQTAQLPLVGWESQERTSFLISIPLETDNTFQQGQTSATPINYELHITQPGTSGTVPETAYAKLTERPPLICLLQDATISIQVMGDGSPSIFG